MDEKYFRFSPDEQGGGGDPQPVESEVQEEQGADQQPSTDSGKKTFTQEELDGIIANRLAKERMRMLKKLGIQDDSEIDTIMQRVNEYDTLKEQNEAFKMEKENLEYQSKLRKLDVDDDFIEFVMTKVEKGEGFEERAKQYLEQNPKVLKESYQPQNSAFKLNGQGMPDFSQMTTEQYQQWRDAHNLDGSPKNK